MPNTETRVQEPTFRELLVVFRRKGPSTPLWLEKYQSARVAVLGLVDRIVDGGGRAAAAQAALDEAKHEAAVRPPVQLRVLDDIPMAYWQAVFPDKLVQFKPLDGLRLDLITVVGVFAVLAQIKVTNPLLEVVSIVSVIVAVVRSVLGYRRMSIRYENFVNDLIATKTLAQEDAVVEFLARAAARQRFAVAALAYAALQRRSERARADVAAAVAAEAASAAAAAAGEADVARRAVAPLLAQPWIARHLPPPAAAPEPAGVGGAAAAALSSLLEEGQQLLSIVSAAARGRAEREEAGVWQGPGMTTSELREEVEALLDQHGMGHIRFDVQGALDDLQRCALVQEEEDGVYAWLQEAGIEVRPPAGDGAGGTAASEPRPVPVAGGALQDVGEVALGQRYMPVDGDKAGVALTQRWTSLLEHAVGASAAMMP